MNGYFIKFLIYSDFLIFFGFGLISPIFAVFIMENIIGGTVLVVGIAETVYMGSKALFRLVFADYLDIENSETKNLYFAILGGVFCSLGAFLYLIIRYPWHLYLTETFLAFGAAIAEPGWYTLFVKHLNPRKRAFQLSLQDTATDIAAAISGVVGGLIVLILGFRSLIFLVGGLSLMGTFVLFRLIQPIREIEHKEYAESKKEFLPIKTGEPLKKVPEPLSIRRFGEPVLRRRAKLIPGITSETQILAKEMIKLMVDNKGKSLTGPQVGHNRRIMVFEGEKGPFVLINPKILKKIGRKISGKEECMSLPGISLEIRRPKEIEIEGYLLEDGKRIKMQAEGLLARIIQHGIDHLDGVLMVDKIFFYQKWGLVKKLRELQLATELGETRERILREKAKLALDREFKAPSTPKMP